MSTLTIPSYYTTYKKETNELGIEIDLPGVQKEEIKVKVLPEAFKLTAKREDYDFFLEKTFPRKIDPKTAKAVYEEGMLLFTATIDNPLKKVEEIKIE